MSDLYNMLIDELEKNDIFVRYSTIEPKIILDLSEHDKPFKVKIRELKESYQKNARELHTLEKDNLFFKQRITEIENKRNKMYEISKILRNNCNNFYKENKELKQRIDELEDKIGDRNEINRCLREKNAKLESENEKLFEYLNGITGNTKEEIRNNIDNIGKINKKPTKINLNDRIKVKLTPLGAEIYYHMFDDTNKKAKKTIIEPHLPKVDEKGYTEFTLWGFIDTYGQYIGVSKPNVIDPIDIIACE